ncbi:MAG: S-layer homology domain-containing protein [Oscillospiraceae bacterium]|nr:S-layer homology domain-containing protein [Oscillospiraceae bacterium]
MKQMKRWLSILLLLGMLLALLPVTAFAADSGSLTAGKPTQQEIVEKSEEITDATTLFVTQPSVSSPYATGKLTDELLESGVSYLNFYRYVAGLPQVQLSAGLNENAQYGAVLLAAVNQLSHYPAQPADMADDFYSQGLSATSTSNIYCSYGYSVNRILQYAVDAFMSDEDTYNMDRVGHRRWILNPRLLNVGFGYAKASSGTPWNYVTLKVFDQSGAKVDYDFVSWPASGHFPQQLFGSDVPWSITLNPEKYQNPNQSQVKVVLTRESDGRKWVFDGTTGEPVSESQAYLTVNNVGYGVSNCIIFRPVCSEIGAYEGTYTIDVSGIYTRSGAAAALHYEIDFFDLYNPTGCSGTDIVTQPTCTQPGQASHSCRFCGSGYSETLDALGHSWNGGDLTVEPTPERDGVVTFQCTRCGETKTQTVTFENPFVDVAEGLYYTEAVKWALREEITNGVSDFQFAPEDPCTRAQIVTFLWRAAGSPAPASGENPFTDVPGGTWYSDAVLWAVEEGITKGYGSETTFCPDQECTRAEIVTFLHRYAQLPAPSSSANPFVDVPAGQWYTDAVLWAVETGITNGHGSATTFCPELACTRGQIVTFLYRAMN